MSAAERVIDKREFFPGLEGLRGYAILVVFIAHYLGPGVLPTNGSPLLSILEQVLSGFLCVVPIFFVISGFLISEILLENRDKEGFFRSFYSRRLLSICPAYFLTLLVVAGVNEIDGNAIDPRFWTHFLFLQNLLPGYLSSNTVPAVDQIGHLWFIAVIVQFYLLWPFVVRLFPQRSRLLRIAWILILLICGIRFFASSLHLSIADSYVSTFTRADAILLGVVLSLCWRDPICRKLAAWAGFAAAAGVSATVFIALWTGTAWPKTYQRVGIIHPIANLTGLLLVMAAMQPESFVCRLCSLRWFRWLGKLSFAIYIFHFTYSSWFLGRLAPRLAVFMPLRQALTISALIAFAFTVALAALNRKFVEQPSKSLKSRIVYHPQS